METLTQDTVLRLPIANPQPGLEWFSRHGCVVERDGVKQVFIGGALMGWFDPKGRDRGTRNVLLVTLAKEPTMHFGHLARAFGVGNNTCAGCAGSRKAADWPLCRNLRWVARSASWTQPSGGSFARCSRLAGPLRRQHDDSAAASA